MVYLNNIIGFLNGVLQQRVASYPAAKWDGVMTQTVKNVANKTIIYPTIINEGKAEFTGIDKRAPFTGYHRLMGTTFTKVLDGEYGDGDYVTINSITDVQLIVWGQRKLINYSPEQFAMVLADALPPNITAPEFKELQIKELKIIETGISYDQRAIFNQEIQGIPYFLGPELFLFSIRYRIQGSYMKGCLNKCEC